MDRKKTTTIVTAAAVFAIAAALPFLFDARLEREEKKEAEAEAFLSGPLRSRMERDSLMQAACVSLVETESGRKPLSALLSRSIYSNVEIVDEDRGYSRAPLAPGDIMQGPTLAFLLDDNRIGPDLTARDGGLTLSSYVADRIAMDWWTQHRYIDKLGDYFGSSEAYSLPKAWQQGPDWTAVASVADGSGIHLSQGQVLTFYDALANGGVRPRHRYVSKRRICSEETAQVMKELLRENVTGGKDILLADHPAHIAGTSGKGTIRHGYVPGLSRTEPHGPVETVSFAGFFPAESPRYTMCVTFYYKPDVNPEETTFPAEVFGELANKLIKEEKPWRQ